MECSALDERYLNLPHDKAFEYMISLKETCLRHGGVFGVLWNNTSFIDPAEVKLH